MDVPTNHPERALSPDQAHMVARSAFAAHPDIRDLIGHQSERVHYLLTGPTAMTGDLYCVLVTLREQDNSVVHVARCQIHPETAAFQVNIDRSTLSRIQSNLKS